MTLEHKSEEISRQRAYVYKSLKQQPAYALRTYVGAGCGVCTHLLEIGVHWRACWASYWAVRGGKRPAHSEAASLSSSYLILPAPVPQVPPAAHPEHRRENYGVSVTEGGFPKHSENICHPTDVCEPSGTEYLLF